MRITTARYGCYKNDNHQDDNDDSCSILNYNYNNNYKKRGRHTWTSANVVIFRHNESSPNIEIICVQLFAFDEMQMRHNCKFVVADDSVGDDAADDIAVAFAIVVAAAAAPTDFVIVSILMTFKWQCYRFFFVFSFLFWGYMKLFCTITQTYSLPLSRSLSFDLFYVIFISCNLVFSVLVVFKRVCVLHLLTE